MNKSRGIAIVLAIFFGALGVHRFYVEQVGKGFLFLFFCWTLVPLIIAIIDIIRWSCMTQAQFQARYKS